MSAVADRIIAAGDRWLAAIGPLVDAADPSGTVSAQSRLLCAGLGVLGEAAHRALGGEARADDVGRAGAMLSLVTKIDDQVIDAPSFHRDRQPLVDRTRAYLAPTLASIRDARPASDEPRCALAADLGRLLRDLAADRARLDRVLATIAEGWEVQVEAVRVLTSHPALVSRAEVADVTRAISGVWLLMIARLGELPSEARRGFTPAEEADFYAFGWAIQRADALADLAKDRADGHFASWPGVLLWDAARDAALTAAPRALYALVRAHGVDRACLPDEAERRALAAALPDLGDVRAILAFVHDYLLLRYRVHPCYDGAADRAVGAGDTPATDTRLFPTREPLACSAR